MPWASPVIHRPVVRRLRAAADPGSLVCVSAFDPRTRPVEGLLAPQRLGAAGVDRVSVRTSRHVRVARGLYAPARAPDCVEQRIVEQATRVAPKGAVTGWAALRLAGVAYADGLDRRGRPRPVPLVAGGRRVGTDDAALVVREQLLPDEVVIRQGVACVPVERALVFEVCRCPDPRERVVLVDMVLAAGATTLSALHRWLDDRPGLRHRALVRAALHLADEHSRSPQETRYRLFWELDAGRGRPLTNRRVLDLDGVLLGVLDLLDAETGVAGEYDGEDHRSRARHVADVRKHSRLQGAGLEVVTAVAGDLDRVGELRCRIDAAYERAGRTPRRFVVGPPHDFDDE